MKEYLVSVVVPVYNVEEYLPECIESIIRQSWRRLEIILVNDGSTDRSGEICKAYQEKDSRIVFLDQENQGLTSARTAGAEAVTGDYVLCVDGDDWIDECLIEELLSVKPAADVFAFGYCEEGAGYSSVKSNVLQDGLYTGSRLHEFQRVMMMEETAFEHGVFPSLCMKLIQSRIYRANQKAVSPDITYGEDAVCTYSCLLDADSVYVKNRPYYHYRIRENSIVHSSQISTVSLKLLYSQLSDRIKKEVCSEQLMTQLNLYMWKALLLKSYDNISTTMPLFPFRKVDFHTRVLIYGAGLMGQVMRDCCMDRNIPVIGWVDRRYQEYQRQGMEVQSLEEIARDDFDIVMISILNKNVAERVKADLLEKGIGEDKIDMLDPADLKETPLPQWLTGEV